MTEAEIITLGDYCEGLLQQDDFGVIVQQFEQQCFKHMMTTDAKALKERESIYAQMRGLQDFLGHMRAYIDAKNEINQRNRTPSDEDAFIEGID